MKNNQLQLVSFEQAKKLKEMGFNYPTYGYYYTDGRLFNNAQGSFIDWNKLGGVYLSAPEIALVFQWLRNEKGIDALIHRTGLLGYDFDIYANKELKGMSMITSEDYSTVEVKALDKALRLLEEKWKGYKHQ